MLRTYTVQSGDTLSGIAHQQLGDASRWPEMFLLNRRIRHPDRISPGQVLTLPVDTATQPPARLYIVRRGDTLSGIARRELGAASRWPEILERNRDALSNPDRIFPDQVLIFPT
jgi:nucleoid-associated protein YgaU